MNEQELKDALWKFHDYLKANGVDTKVGFFWANTKEGQIQLSIGTPEYQALGLAALVAAVNGYKVVKK